MYTSLLHACFPVDTSSQATSMIEPCHSVRCITQVGKPAEEDLASWGHHASGATVPDKVMHLVQAEHPSIISFVFTNQVRPCPTAITHLAAVSHPGSCTVADALYTPACSLASLHL